MNLYKLNLFHYKLYIEKNLTKKNQIKIILNKRKNKLKLENKLISLNTQKIKKSIILFFLKKLNKSKNKVPILFLISKILLLEKNLH